jgi:hypothetical protein
MQRSRVVALAVNATVAGALAVAGCASHVDPAGAGSTTPSAPIVDGSLSPASGQPCAGDSLAFAEGDRLSPETGEHPFSITVTNRGAVDCWLSGYPQIRLIDARGQPLPMAYFDGGGYVTDAPPPVVLLRPGREGAFVFAKYRCDLGGEQPATHVTVALPGSSTFSPVAVPDGEQVSEYCGPNDPGDGVDISPFEPDIYSALFQGSAPPPASSPPPLSPPSSPQPPGRS